MPINPMLVDQYRKEDYEQLIAILRQQLADAQAERDALANTLLQVAGLTDWQQAGYTVDDYRAFLQRYDASGGGS